MIEYYLENVRKEKPLVHNITNYVTANDCANIILASGALPIMGDDVNEVEEITSICKSLNINIGTLNSRSLESMILAGKTANKLDIPIVFDPVGVGVSKFRIEFAKDLIDRISFSVIRGNISEIKKLSGLPCASNGVDASELDKTDDYNLDTVIENLKSFSEKIGAVIAVTGVIDIVCDNKTVYVIRNGNKMMEDVTGTGCQLSSLISAYIAANRNDIVGATAAAVCSMGLAGEIAYKNLSENDGNSTYRNRIIDAIYNMSVNQLIDGAKYEMR